MFRIRHETDRPALDDVAPFFDRLTELSFVDWLALGQSVAAGPAARTARATASVILEATLADRGLEIAAWYVRDARQTIAFLVPWSAPRLSRTQRRLFSTAYDAAERAALGVLARDYLAPLDFETLTAPFQGRTGFS